MPQTPPGSKQPTAKEALARYFKNWAPQDSSLKLYIEQNQSREILLNEFLKEEELCPTTTILSSE